MKTPALSTFILLIGILSSSAVFGRGHGGGFGHYGGGGGHYGHGGGIYFGLGYPYYGYYGYGYPYYYPPAYYPPAVVTVPSSPPVYIQQQPAPSNQADTSGYWHYCGNPEGYYPYVQECPGGWQLVEPTPPR
ncbi:hypothetical protein [Methylomonas koyamae]|uniref:hypothetical protein n=1 Tax=Methylomonas koyamae TaxID=702114 RepID=UPI001129D9F6|nr:hypothetical protein [Methylomonas koyamae]TPQ27586.1 hypothetical protein C2U68_07705 [Methylomonas koyamae]